MLFSASNCSLSLRAAQPLFEFRHIEVFFLSAPFQVFRPVVVSIFIKVDHHSLGKGLGAMKCLTHSAMHLNVPEEFGINGTVAMSRPLAGASHNATNRLRTVEPKTTIGQRRVTRRKQNAAFAAR